MVWCKTIGQRQRQEACDPDRRRAEEDCSNFSWKYKAWLYQHVLLPRLIWPTMLYDRGTQLYYIIIREDHQPSPENMTSSPTQFLQRRTLCNQLQLPLSSLVEEFRTAKTRLVLTLRYSSVEQIREAWIVTWKEVVSYRDCQPRWNQSWLDPHVRWSMEVDRGKMLVFPVIVQTNLRPDIILSETGKKLIMIELTAPWETRCEEAYERKNAVHFVHRTSNRMRVNCSPSKYRRQGILFFCVPTNGSNWEDWQRQAQDYPKTEPSYRACV